MISSTMIRCAPVARRAASTVAKRVVAAQAASTSPVVDFETKHSGAALTYLEALDRKMAAIVRMEQDLFMLEEHNEAKHHAYNNVGLMTAADIDALFDRTKGKKRDIRDSLEEIKNIIEEVRTSNPCPNILLKTNAAGVPYLETLDKKMATVAQIEEDLNLLEENHTAKQEAYSNVGMMTAGDIDALFDRSKTKKGEIRANLKELKSIIDKVRLAIYE